MRKVASEKDKSWLLSPNMGSIKHVSVKSGIQKYSEDS
jgi:hypothetical protein